jgi:hypothetical protein
MTRAYHKHGLTGTPEYHVWEAIVQRCTNPNNPSWRHYGGRGIRLHPKWRRDFGVFIAEVGPRPAPVNGKRWTIERKKNSLGYVPGNVVWASDKAQHRNLRTNRWLTFQGERLTIGDMARRHGISPTQLHKRLTNGWTLKRALLTPTKMLGRKVWAVRNAQGRSPTPGA